MSDEPTKTLRRTYVAADEPTPHGLCQCGCGHRTALSRQTDTRRGYVKGEPMRFLIGHGGHEKLRKSLDSMYVVGDRGYVTPCWIWQGGTTGNGYGRTRANGRMDGAHRVYFEREHGLIPEGLHLDHLCRVPLCVNPLHLEAVSHAENCRRGVNAKLTASQVAEIRAARSQALAAEPLTKRDLPRRRVKGGAALRERLAAQYGVRADYIKQIWRGEKWAP